MSSKNIRVYKSIPINDYVSSIYITLIEDITKDTYGMFYYAYNTFAGTNVYLEESVIKYYNLQNLGLKLSQSFVICPSSEICSLLKRDQIINNSWLITKSSSSSLFTENIRLIIISLLEQAIYN